MVSLPIASVTIFMNLSAELVFPLLQPVGVSYDFASGPYINFFMLFALVIRFPVSFRQSLRTREEQSNPEATMEVALSRRLTRWHGNRDGFLRGYVRGEFLGGMISAQLAPMWQFHGDCGCVRTVDRTPCGLKCGGAQ